MYNILGNVSGLYGIFLQVRRIQVWKIVYLETLDREWLCCYGVEFTDYLGI